MPSLCCADNRSDPGSTRRLLAWLPGNSWVISGTCSRDSTKAPTARQRLRHTGARQLIRKPRALASRPSPLRALLFLSFKPPNSSFPVPFLGEPALPASLQVEKLEQTSGCRAEPQGRRHHAPRARCPAGGRQACRKATALNRGSGGVGAPYALGGPPFPTGATGPRARASQGLGTLRGLALGGAASSLSARFAAGPLAEQDVPASLICSPSAPSARGWSPSPARRLQEGQGLCLPGLFACQSPCGSR